MNSAALAFLADKGLSLEEIIEFARISERKADPSNADRQARYRARRKEQKDAVVDDGDDCVTRYCNGVTPPNDIYSNPPELNPQPTKVGLPPKPRRGISLPDDWEPCLTPASQRIVDGWPPGRLDDELAKFRDYAADKGRTSKDWQAAFRTWITNSEKWNPTHGQPKQPNQRGGSNRDAAQLALAKLGYG